VEDLVARVVGPYIVDAPDPGAKELTAAIDQALSTTMSLILHHPDVQAIEAQWRALDFLARRIETGADVALTLYDVSAEEVAVDLATTADPAESGLYRMLSGTAAGDEGFAVVAGLYTFEATPPHAELLARIGGIASRLGAPFLAALEPHAADASLQEAHPSVAEAFGALAALSEADAVGLVAPPVLLRRPYGAKSDPVDAFAYEEFDRAEGLTGLLWGNPVLVAATLLAANRGPGSALELDDMPYHITTDRHGDQVALPATQRIMTESRVAAAQGWGVMPVLATRGGDRVRLGGFHAVTGRPLAGHWGAAAGRRPPSDAPGRGVGLSLSHQLTAAELADLRGRASAGQATGPADIDPDLAALLEDPE
ncbi:MAG: type VI secretion system contractile sheath large subunit, partial [Pseudomonadota bacterium]